MGWSIGWDHIWKRDIGYGVPAYCDFPDCNEEIDRGLSYLCNNAEGDHTVCGLYFCEKHRYEEPYCMSCNLSCTKLEHPEWINWKLTNESWQQWRDENPEEVEKLKEQLK